MLKSLYFADNIVGLYHCADVMCFAEHVKIKKLQVIRTNKLIVHISFDFRTYPVLSLESVYMFYLSFLDKHSIELFYALLVVDI